MGRKKLSDKPTNQIHTKLENSLYIKLNEFAKARKRSQTSILEEALELLFASESVEPNLDMAIKEVLNRRFSYPKCYTARSFYTTLYTLATRYMDESSKEFWGEAIYLFNRDLSHAELFSELKDEIEAYLKKHEKLT